MEDCNALINKSDFAIEKPRLKPPTMLSKKRMTSSDEELTDFYTKLRDYHMNLEYDSERVARTQKYYKVVARICRFLSRMKRTGVLNVDKIITDTSMPMIYTSNHIGSFDQFYIPSLLGDMPLHYLVKNKVTSWPVRWNLIYKPTGVVVIDTENLRSWSYARAKLIQYLLHGNNVFIFAEGSRRGENNIGDFNPGIAQVAQDAGVKVQTLAIKNTSKLFFNKPIVCGGETFTIDPREDLKHATERIKIGVIDAFNEILKYEGGLLHENRY
jgi:1-acyl-sn-glycerol-3-phosphate acyltransferase